MQFDTGYFTKHALVCNGHVIYISNWPTVLRLCVNKHKYTLLLDLTASVQLNKVIDECPS